MKPYYTESGITIYCGDCREVMSCLSPVSVNQVLADLPYGITECEWDRVIPFGQLWDGYRRVLASNGVAVLTASQPFSSDLVTSNRAWFRHEWVWIKNRGSNFANTVREPFKEHEVALVFSPGGWTYNPQMQERTGGGLDLIGKRVGTGTKDREGLRKFMHFDGIESLPELRVPSSWQKFNTETGLHSTQKPVAWMDYLIRTYTNPGDLVLDNAMGSGTTLVAARNLGRRAIGIDIREECCATAVQRLAQGVLFGIGGAA